MLMQPAGEVELTEDFLIPIPTLSAANSPKVVYWSFTRNSPEEYQIGSFNCLLKFVSKEVDPSTGEPEAEGYEDEYQLEDTDLSAADYIVPTYVTFAAEWDRMRGGVNVTETFSLPAMESIKGESAMLLAYRGHPDKDFEKLRAIPSSRSSTCSRSVGAKTHNRRPYIRSSSQGWWVAEVARCSCGAG